MHTHSLAFRFLDQQEPSAACLRRVRFVCFLCLFELSPQLLIIFISSVLVCLAAHLQHLRPARVVQLLLLRSPQLPQQLHPLDLSRCSQSRADQRYIKQTNSCTSLRLCSRKSRNMTQALHSATLSIPSATALPYVFVTIRRILECSIY